MSVPATPSIEARVSPELGALLARIGHTHRRPATRRLASGHDKGSADRQPRSASGEPWEQCSLRRDGARPDRFRGALLFEVTSGADPATGRLRLFATADGEAVAHLAYHPPETLPARPVFRTARITSAESLWRFVSDTGPEACFAVCGSGGEEPAYRKACDALRLPVELPGLAAPERSSLKLCEGTR